MKANYELKKSQTLGHLLKATLNFGVIRLLRHVSDVKRSKSSFGQIKLLWLQNWSNVVSFRERVK